MARYGEEAYRRYRSWNVLKNDIPARHLIYRSLHRLIRPLAEEGGRG
jgi:hypothetical protein